MGFFKNLIKGKFKKIAGNAVKNIASGKLIKGGGFLGNMINKGVNTASGGVLTKINSLNLLGQNNPVRHQVKSVSHLMPTGTVFSKPRLSVRVPVGTTPAQQSQINEVVASQSRGEISKSDAKKLVIQIGGTETEVEEDDDNTTMYIIGAVAIAALIWFKNK